MKNKHVQGKRKKKHTLQEARYAEGMGISDMLLV
jgi:hypothetical protein